jgi:hypothetical protein
VTWEIEGWKVSEAGRYRSGVCDACTKAISLKNRKRRRILASIGFFFLLFCPVCIYLLNSPPAIFRPAMSNAVEEGPTVQSVRNHALHHDYSDWSGDAKIALLIGFIPFTSIGACMLMYAYSLKKAVAIDVYHRKVWEEANAKTLAPSWGILPRRKGLLGRFVLADWETLRSSYEQERLESGWSHFILKRSQAYSTVSPAKQEALERFKAKHMGEIMDRFPHKNR